MTDLEYWTEIYDRLKGKYHLKVLETSVYEIPERVRERYGTMFIVYNLRKQRYEAHTLDNKGATTFAFAIPTDVLDCRTLTIARRSDTYAKGQKALERRMRARNEKVARRKERQRKDDLRQIAKEIRPAAKKLAWRM